MISFLVRDGGPDWIGPNRYYLPVLMTANFIEGVESYYGFQESEFMRVAGVREFRDHAVDFLSGNDLVFVTKLRKVVNLLVSMSKSEELPLELLRELITNLGSPISNHLKKSGVTARTVNHVFKTWRKSCRTNRCGGQCPSFRRNW